jgi:hypothetical protein
VFDGTQLRQHGAADKHAEPAMSVPSPARPRPGHRLLLEPRLTALIRVQMLETYGEITSHATLCRVLASVVEYDASELLAWTRFCAILVLEGPPCCDFRCGRGRQLEAPWTANHPSRSNAGFGSDDYRLPRSIPRRPLARRDLGFRRKKGPGPRGHVSR